jgi:hypothetical protein
VLALAGGGPLAWWVVTSGEPAPLRRLRSLHSGSVNRYAAWQAAGLVAVVVALGLGAR